MLIGILACSCKKDKTTTYDVRLESTGTSYDLTVKSNGSPTKSFLDKIGLSGNTVYSFTPLESEDISVGYTTRAGMTLKVFINNELKGDYKLSAGNGFYIFRR